MQETKLFQEKKDNRSENFVFIEDINNHPLTTIPINASLCVIKSNFSTEENKAIKKVMKNSENIEFWIATNYTSRENIMSANKMGIKNVIPYPIDKKLIREFFKNNNALTTKQERDNKMGYSSIAGLKVMIVDDNNLNIELLEEILNKFNLNITSYQKSTEAITAIYHEKFDLFLLDIMMPEISGFDLAKKIKEIEINKHTPIIFISALSDSTTKITGYDLGSYAYIEKPFDINIVTSQIYNILKTQQAKNISNSEQDDFFASLAHDLRTPIRAEINALQMLLDNNFGSLDKNQHEILEDILNSTKFMQDMVENILSKNKIDYGELKLSWQKCSLKDLTMHCIELTKYILNAKNQRIKFKCKTKNTTVYIDFIEMKRALHNLISNASAYSAEGTEIIIEIFEENGKTGISIQDFGKGIALENKEDIFLKYMSQAKENKTIGTGLGLYITKRIIEAHSGEIILESEIGQGSRITILLPIYTKV